MGCHTWCYVSLPNKQRDWRNYFVKSLRYEKRNSEKVVNDPELIRKTVEEIRSDYQETIKILKERLTTSEDTETQTRLNQYESLYDQYNLDNIIKQYSESVKILNEVLNNFKEEFLDDPKQFFSWWETVPESIQESIQILSSGLIIIKDNKIYREDGLGRLKYPKINDADFRISNYEAEPCYTAQDCFDRCLEEGVELSEKTKKRIIDWFSEYPDTIIEFG